MSFLSLKPLLLQVFMDIKIAINITILRCCELALILNTLLQIPMHIKIVRINISILIQTLSNRNSLSIFNRTLQQIHFDMIQLEQILDSCQQIKSYFIKNAQTPEQYLKLAIQLLLQSITRKEQKPEKQPVKTVNHHYNVAYIKHNRFLSPSQKKQVTPKVTEMIPVSPGKIVIYGKPKVKLDNGYGCPMHELNCQQQSYSQNTFQQSEDQNQSRQKHYEQTQKQNECPKQLQNSQLMQQNQTALPRQYDEYLSPKNKLNKKTNKSKKDRSNNQTVRNIRSPKGKQHQNYQNRMTSPKSFVSPTHQICQQNYTNIESKIKELIQRDKQSRQMEKQLQKQKNQIQDIYERQNRLLMMQKYQKQILNNQNVQGENYENQTWKITKSNNQGFRKSVMQSSFSSQSQSQQSIVNLHGHADSNSRVNCYDCEIQRLRKRKEKAKMAITQISREQVKRSKMLEQIMHSKAIANQSQLYSRPSDRKINSVQVI